MKDSAWKWMRNGTSDAKTCGIGKPDIKCGGFGGYSFPFSSEINSFRPERSASVSASMSTRMWQ